MALKVSQKVQLYDREVVLWQKNVLKRAFGKNVTPVKWQRGSNGREGEKMGFLGGGHHRRRRRQCDQRQF